MDFLIVDRIIRPINTIFGRNWQNIMLAKLAIVLIIYLHTSPPSLSLACASAMSMDGSSMTASPSFKPPPRVCYHHCCLILSSLIPSLQYWLIISIISSSRCYTCGPLPQMSCCRVVCMSVGHNHEPFKMAEQIEVQFYCGLSILKEQFVRWGSRSNHAKGHFWGVYGAPTEQLNWSQGGRHIVAWVK